jgi:hypothetical protein
MPTIDTEAVVRLYEGEWFSEGRVTKIENGLVTVDFCDWVERFEAGALAVEYPLYQEVWVVCRRGEIVADFRD